MPPPVSHGGLFCPCIRLDVFHACRLRTPECKHEEFIVGDQYSLRPTTVEGLRKLESQVS